MVAALFYALLTPWLARKFPNRFRHGYEPLFFDASLSFIEKIARWRTQPVTSLQLVTNVMLLAVGGERGVRAVSSSFRGARSASFDVQLHIRESITTIVSMDSGPAPRGASRNDECGNQVRFTPPDFRAVSVIASQRVARMRAR